MRGPLTITDHAAHADRPGPVLVADLYADIAGLARLAVSELDRGAWTDAYLLICGMSQLVADYLQPDPMSLRRATSVFAQGDARVGHLVARTVTAPSAAVLEHLAALRPAEGRLRRVQSALDDGLSALAGAVLGPAGAACDDRDLVPIRHVCTQLADRSGELPRALRDDVVRLPSCFRSFDQHPDDVRTLVGTFAAADTDADRSQPLMVVGIRTSGTYLAPLVCAALAAGGYDDVGFITMRPGRRLHPEYRTLLDGIVARGGRVIVCDDPPGSGTAMARACRQLEEMAVPAGRIVLMLALFDDVSSLPEVLGGYHAVLLGFEDWAVHQRLEDAWVHAQASQLIGDTRRVESVARSHDRVSHAGRGHVGAVYRVRIRDRSGRRPSEEQWCVEGVGFGYYGHHAMAVAAPIAEYLPTVYGIRDGLMFRQWLDDDDRASERPAEQWVAMAPRIVDYVRARRTALPVPFDASLRQSGQYPVWEAISMLLSRACGPAWPLGRGIAIDRAVQGLLQTPDPSVIDGRTGLSEWFADGARATMIKADWHQGATWNLGLGSCDAIFDLAGAAAISGDPAFLTALRAGWASAEGCPIDDERWLLYQLAHLWGLPATRREDRQQLRRACSRAMQEYFRGIYFADLDPAADGPLCGIDIDGVLESEVLGFPSLTPASAVGLRALIAHGYRPVLVTGRSIGEVAERCHAYGLVGGVAEYGSATYVADGDLTTPVTSAAARDAIERLRAELRTREGIEVNDDYAFGIRAFVRNPAGARRPLPDSVLADARYTAHAEATVAIVGDAQTDLVGAGISKGAGVRALVAALAAPPRLAFAVGDTAADESLLACADRPFAPGHGKDALGGCATVARRPYQAGFAEAVGELIGHRPGGCPLCAVPAGSPGREVLLGLLGLREAGIERMPLRLASLSVPRRTRVR